MIVRRQSPLNILADSLRWVVFAVVALVVNLPVLSTILTSFKTDADINAYPPKWIFTPTLDHYRTVLTSPSVDYLHYVMNSIVIAVLGTIFAIVLTLPAAYAIARYKVGAKWLLPIITNLRALPLIIFAIPFYFMFQTVGLLDTRLGLALISCIINIPIALVLFVGFVQDLPRDFDDAAKIDGASMGQILRHVVVPLSRPVMLAVFILSFIYSWNEFLFGLILTTKSAVPVTVGATFFVTSRGIEWGPTAAAMTIGVLPPLILGLFAYPYMGKSMLAGGVKG
ncbi:sugar ABC transporter permease [Kaistia algarum]|uniref:carbohydrate ABC transporter permease n=1 Tax=Kaistia algarum TaxID=2083279 RepID=UPI000CE92BF5|nr:carbohydrate ABC transporter permease [Kaistia algarum]MCX5513321.1 carbohydrate ABC transporter permease [Kaistia algarum]PPE81226.1 sugar ABC transporter permease [Kaistia algarum]